MASQLQILEELSEEQVSSYGEKSEHFHNAYTKLISLALESPKVQDIIMKHCKSMNSFLYSIHEEFKGIGYSGYLEFASQILNDDIVFDANEHYSHPKTAPNTRYDSVLGWKLINKPFSK